MMIYDDQFDVNASVLSPRLFVGILPAHLWQILLRHLRSDSCEAKPKEGSRSQKWIPLDPSDPLWNTYVVWETARYFAPSTLQE